MSQPRTVHIDPNESIRAGFDKMIRACYPEGIGPHQMFDLWQFYLSGAVAVHAYLMKHSEGTEEEGAAKMAALDQDLRQEAATVSATNRARIAAAQAKRN